MKKRKRIFEFFSPSQFFRYVARLRFIFEDKDFQGRSVTKGFYDSKEYEAFLSTYKTIRVLEVTHKQSGSTAKFRSIRGSKWRFVEAFIVKRNSAGKKFGIRRKKRYYRKKQ